MVKSKSEKKRRDVQMSAANDKEGTEANPFNSALPLKEPVKKVVDNLKKKAKRLPNIREFSSQELDGLAKRLTARLSDLNTVEEEKKSVIANYTDKIKAHKLEISKTARQHRDGYELVDHDCFLVYDYKKREVRYKSANTRKVVEIKPFGPGDDQRRLPL